ncbi:DinB family protein [Parapedobacter tibetensis]|uniref:DinB family protein n=1 Tax=Parapedobacter tibetensis TaxID=2972951 RepID=UPI00214D9B79|nr:DinB family protein [Parapedobacter tibetensis]
MTQQEIITSFHSATQELLRLLSSLDDQKLNEQPFEGSWTAAQVGEHLLKSYSVAETLNGTTKPTERAPDEKLGALREMFLNFGIKMKSPDFILPRNGFIAKKALLDGLQQRLEQLHQVINRKAMVETCLDFELPGSGALTRLEWIGFVAVHTQRHNHQLKKIIEVVGNNPIV